ncbi:HTH domain-containing protein [Microbacterium sp. RD1]|uniref:HTH domain-containing protein n=1 Tax=Microbacterium sp. RD1 TaxID=3457313 RepID=UPI003FA58764
MGEAINASRPSLLVLGEFERDGALSTCPSIGLLRAIRASRLELEVIIVTSQPSAYALQDALRLGVNDYLVAPVGPDRFIQSVRQLSAYHDADAEHLSQPEIDQLRSIAYPSRAWVPRELSTHRLEIVRRMLESETTPITAATLAAALGISRVTARRYLEYLVTLGEIDVDSISEARGRPRKLYSRAS